MTDSERAKKVAGLIASGRHLFIEASAGSGKTTRLVDLVSEIIESGRATISEILCVTYTEKAASELKAKIYTKLTESVSANGKNAAEKFSLNRIGTIHNFCLRSLKEDAVSDLSESMEAATMDDADLFDAARESVYREVWGAFPADQLNGYLEELSFGKGGSDRSLDKELKSKALYAFGSGATPFVPAVESVAAIETAIDFKAFTLFKIVEKMREQVKTGNVMTFSRMVTLFAETLKDEMFAQKIRARYKYALIDEFQDTDAVQWQIFSSLFLSGGLQKLIAVGDPKQAIYKFRGADVFIYLKARAALEALGAVMDKLPENFRSTPEILQVLNSVFLRDTVAEVWERAGIIYQTPVYGGVTQSTANAATGAEFYTAPKGLENSESLFAELAADRIAALQLAQPDWSVAVIAYRHKALTNIAAALQARGIDFAYYKQKPDFSRLETEHLKVFLQSFLLPTTEGYWLAKNTFFLKGRDAKYYADLSTSLQQGRIVHFMQALARDHAPLHLMLQSSADQTEYHAWRILFQQLLTLVGRTIFDLESLLKTLYDLEADAENDEGFGDMLRSGNAVTLLTVQSAKGLDWNVVVLADGINDKRWKDFAFFHDAGGNAVIPLDSEDFDAGENKLMHIAEEAAINQLNLLYVAMTRPKHKLIAYIAPPQSEKSSGPVARFLRPWIESGVALKSGAQITDLSQAHSQMVSTPASPGSRPVKPVPIDHGNIRFRVARRTSFTQIAQAESPEALFADTVFSAPQMTDPSGIPDVLPRGSETGQLLHNFLEVCDFTLLNQYDHPKNAELRSKIMATAALQYNPIEHDVPKISERIWDIMHCTATAALPLSGQNGKTTLQNLKPENLWREMPFWSAAATHLVLREKDNNGLGLLTMHGFMDLVFTTDAIDYYILDYKSNSLTDIAPETIGAYTTAHYRRQAEIYSEALNAYLTSSYPGTKKRVAGCYFLFLRYLKPGESTGIHFMDYDNA